MLYRPQIAYLLNWSFNRWNKLPRWIQTFSMVKSYKYLWQEVSFKLKIWKKSRTHRLRKIDTNMSSFSFEKKLSKPFRIVLKGWQFPLEGLQAITLAFETPLIKIFSTGILQNCGFFRLWRLHLSFALTPLGQNLMNHYATCPLGKARGTNSVVVVWFFLSLCPFYK